MKAGTMWATCECERRGCRGPARRAAVRVLALAIVLVGVLAFPMLTLADDGPTVSAGSLAVAPGDTLSGIAARYGIPLADLMTANGLRHPRDLYPGQILRLPGLGLNPDALQSLTLAWGEDLALVARRAGLPLAELARANGILHPGQLSLGMRMVAPAGVPARAVIPSFDLAPRVGASVLEGVSLWDIMWLNPDPIPSGGRLFVPGEDSPETWVLDLSVAPQPVPRGQTAMIRLVTAEPVSCTVQYLDRTEVCYTGDAGDAAVAYAFLGLPALLPPGEHVATLTLRTASSEIALPVSLRVSPGRFDYERIDLPPDRQSLLDPARTQAERETIAALRTVRSPDRRWTLPFLAPLQGNITSYYGSRRSYGQGFSSYHAGADFQAATGAPVIAPASGRVALAEPLVVRGTAVMIDHGWGVMTGYWHLSTLDVTVGQEVEAGTRIGAVGNTGLSTGSHLHWELWVNGIAVDPLPWLEIPPGDFEVLMRTGLEVGP